MFIIPKRIKISDNYEIHNKTEGLRPPTVPPLNSLVLHMKLDTVNGTNYTLDNSQYRNDGLMKNFEPAPINNFSAAVFANETQSDDVSL